MSSESEPLQTSSSDGWDRVAGELRACKESQRRAWGDVDDATLGRYLAGEIAGDELAQLEHSLAELPELRKLTDLVRDVLSDVAPAAEPAPRILPLASPRPRGRQPLFTARRASLLAAACLLVIVGAAMPRSDFAAAPVAAEKPLALRDAMAMRDVGAVSGERTGPRLRAKSKGPRIARAGQALATPPSPAAPGAIVSFKAEVADLTPRQAVTLHREGFQYRFQGDVTRAEANLSKVHLFCMKKLGPDHPRTKASGKHLAEVYNLALNTPGGAQVQAFSVQTNVVTPKHAEDSAGKLREHLANQPIREIKAQVVPVLVKALKATPNASQRQALVRAIGQLGPAAESAVPALADCLKQPSDSGEVREVLLALEGMGEAAKLAVPALMDLSGQAAPASVQLMMASPASTGQATDQKATHRGAGDAERQLARRVLHRLQGCEGRVGVRDEAGCFTLKSVRANSEQMKQLAQTAGVEVMVETCQGVTDTKDSLAKMGPRAVHLVIDSTGPSVTVKLSEQLIREGFSAEKLQEQVMRACGKKQFDRALTDGVRAIRKQAAEGKK